MVRGVMIEKVSKRLYYHINTGKKLNVGSILNIGELVEPKDCH